MVGWTSSCLSFSNAFCCEGSQSHVFLELKSSCKGWESSASFGVNFPSWFSMPRKHLSSILLVGCWKEWIAEVLWGLRETPRSSIRCPRNVSLCWLNSHLSRFRVTPASLMVCRTSWSWWLCSACVFPNINTSSMWQSTPSFPARICSIWCWKCSGELAIPNGIRLK